MDEFSEFPSIAEFESLRAMPRRKPILLSVFRDACPNCLSSRAEGAIAREFGQRLALAKLNADKAPEVESRLNVKLVPTLILFAGEQARKFDQLPGADGKNVLRWLTKQLADAPSGRPQSARAPVALTTRSYLASSARTKAAN